MAWPNISCIFMLAGFYNGKNWADGFE